MTDAVHASATPDAMHEDEDIDRFSGYATPDEAREVFDEAARYYMGISGEEFLRRWDAGEWQTTAERESIMSLLMIMPLVR